MKRMKRLFSFLEEEYRKKTRKSCALFQRASRYMVRGGSHSLRLWKPYPFFLTSASGSTVEDADGNRYIDYWQGHYANILGHNPELVRRKLLPYVKQGALHTGFEGSTQLELAEKIISRLEKTGLKIRFTTSGTLASTFAVMLAMGYTGRDFILKVGGGWHGSSPYLLKGVKYHPGRGFSLPDSAGLPEEFSQKIIITRFNDTEQLVDRFKKYGSKLACFILEPFIGVGGFLFSSREYLETARDLCDRYGVVLIFDEIISGFRFAATGLQKLYGISPDLSLFGKLIGGGQAVAAVVGRRKIMEACEKAGKEGRVLFEGGTFSAHEEYLRAGLVMIDYLEKNEEKVYPRIGQLAEELRRGIEKSFQAEGIRVVCTGRPNEVVGFSSFFMVNFPKKEFDYKYPEDVWNPDRSDVFLREEVLKLALLLQEVHVVHGGGCLSTAHTQEEIKRTIEAYAQVARTFKKFLKS